MTKPFVSDATPRPAFWPSACPFDVFCRDYLHVSHRGPGQRLVNQPDGLPIVEYGRTQLVHVPTGEAWAKSRMRQRNPIRRGRAA